VKIEGFEDIEAWQEARALVKMIYTNEEKFDEHYSRSDEGARLISGFIRYLPDKDKPRELKEPK